MKKPIKGGTARAATRIAIAIAVIVIVLITLSCAEPYDMTSVIKGKTLVYSSGANTKDTFVFAADGKSGTYAGERYTYQYPDAASEGDYTKKAWVRTGGQKATFTYDPKSLEIVFTFTHDYAKTPGATTSYASDYKEYTILELEKAWNPDATSAHSTRKRKLMFNQDSVTYPYLSTGNNQWLFAESSSFETVAGGKTYSYSDTYSESLTVSGSAIVKNNTWDSESKTDGTVTKTKHKRYDTTYTVYASYRLGDTKATEVFTDMWKKDGVVTFRCNQTMYAQKEWEGSTEPTAPTVSGVTGLGETGASGSNPLNYYKIDRNTSQSTINLQHYGTFITYFTGSASRGLDL